jgi:hypothetical protein
MTAGAPSASVIVRRRGGPLVMLALVLAAWTGTRAIWWENPFPPLSAAITVPFVAADPSPSALPMMPAVLDEPIATFPKSAAAPLIASTETRRATAAPALRPANGQSAQLAAAQHSLWRIALQRPMFQHAGASGFQLISGGSQAQPPFLPSRRSATAIAAGPAAPPWRWSLDAWAFVRQGSNSAPVSEGRVPIYGASQVGALLQYRLAAQTARDPRLYARAYHALVPRGESELAAGVSVRPIVEVPVRVAGELRYTDAAFTNELRPSAFLVTELPPMALPYGVQLDAYGQAGWVGGASSTAFADGQASVTRMVGPAAKATGDTLRIAIGAAAWGGAQDDAQRLDLGPTVRLDLTVGEVPARFSIDWRERVGGQAGPDSGLAATLSARF